MVCQTRTNTDVLFAVQVGVLAPHDHVWNLHYNHEVSVRPNSHHASICTRVCILTDDKPHLW